MAPLADFVSQNHQDESGTSKHIFKNRPKIIVALEFPTSFEWNDDCDQMWKELCSIELTDQTYLIFTKDWQQSELIASGVVKAAGKFEYVRQKLRQRVKPSEPGFFQRLLNRKQSTAAMVLSQAQTLLKDSPGEVHFVKMSLNPLKADAWKALTQVLNTHQVSFSCLHPSWIVGLTPNFQKEILKKGGRLNLHSNVPAIAENLKKSFGKTVGCHAEITLESSEPNVLLHGPFCAYQETKYIRPSIQEKMHFHLRLIDRSTRIGFFATFPTEDVTATKLCQGITGQVVFTDVAGERQAWKVSVATGGSAENSEQKESSEKDSNLQVVPTASADLAMLLNKKLFKLPW